MEKDICLACQKAITDDSLVLTCSECGFSYHAGNCSGVGEAAVKSKPEIDKTWLCPTCKASKLRSQSSGKTKPEQGADVGAKLTIMNKRIALLLPLIDKIEDLLSVKETVKNIEKTVEFLSSKYDTLLTLVTTQGQEISELKERMQKVETETSIEEVKKLRRELNDLDQYSRRQNLEVHGIEKSEGENLLVKLNNVARKLNIPELTAKDVEAIHRLPAREENTPAIMVRFSSRTTKEQWTEQKTHLVTKVPGVRFLDNLTPLNKKLLWVTKSKALERSYKFVWQKNGRILVRKKEGDSAIQIRTEDDLAKMV